MKVNLSVFLVFLLLLLSCVFADNPSAVAPDQERLLRLQAFIHRIGSSGFYPAKGEKMYPFRYALRTAEGGKIVRQGEGFVLIHEPLWSLVQRWRDPVTGNHGQRMLIVDRREREFEAEVRQWPEGSRRQKGNNWTCMRLADPSDEGLDLFGCEYRYPDGTERVIHDSESWPFYKGFLWNGDGLLVVKETGFKNSSVQYRYDGLKLKRIEFRSGETIITFAEFTYE